MLHRLAHAVIARAQAARAAATGNIGREAERRMLALHAFVKRQEQRLVLVFLIAALQTVGNLGDVPSVAKTVPAVGILATALDWCNLQLPLPGTLERASFAGRNATMATLEAEKEFSGCVFWFALAATIVVVVDAPLRALAQRRIRSELADESATARARERQGLPVSDVRPSTQAQPDLDDEWLAIAPKALTWLALLMYQGMVQKTTAVLFLPEDDVSPAAFVMALAAAVAIAGCVAATCRLAWTATRGPRARATFRRTPTKDPAGKEPDAFWVDRVVPEVDASDGRHAAMERRHPTPWYSRDRTPSVHRDRVDILGEDWTGFTSRYSAAVAPFCPASTACCEGAPLGIVAVLIHRGLSGALVGVPRIGSILQVAALVGVNVGFALYCFWGKPFIQARVGHIEGTIASAVAACLGAQLWALATDNDGDDASRDTVTIIMGLALLVALLPRIAIVLHNCWKQMTDLEDNVAKALRSRRVLVKSDKGRRERRKRRRAKRKARKARIRQKRRAWRLRQVQMQDDDVASGDSEDDENVADTEAVEKLADMQMAASLAIALEAEDEEIEERQEEEAAELEEEDPVETVAVKISRKQRRQSAAGAAALGLKMPPSRFTGRRHSTVAPIAKVEKPESIQRPASMPHISLTAAPPLPRAASVHEPIKAKTRASVGRNAARRRLAEYKAKQKAKEEEDESRALAARRRLGAAHVKYPKAAKITWELDQARGARRNAVTQGLGDEELSAQLLARHRAFQKQKQQQAGAASEIRPLRRAASTASNTGVAKRKGRGKGATRRNLDAAPLAADASPHSSKWGVLRAVSHLGVLRRPQRDRASHSARSRSGTVQTLPSTASMRSVRSMHSASSTRSMASRSRSTSSTRSAASARSMANRSKPATRLRSASASSMVGRSKSATTAPSPQQPRPRRRRATEGFRRVESQARMQALVERQKARMTPEERARYEAEVERQTVGGKPRRRRRGTSERHRRRRERAHERRERHRRRHQAAAAGQMDDIPEEG